MTEYRVHTRSVGGVWTILIVSGLIVCLRHEITTMSTSDLMKFGRRMRRIRLDIGLTQEGLAEKSGLHPTYIGGIERGERNVGLENIIKIARALGVTPSDIFSAFEGGGDD